MPLFELFRAKKGNEDAAHERTDPPFTREDELVELVWENGQVAMHGQSSRVRRSPPLTNPGSIPSYGLPSHSPRRDRNSSSMAGPSFSGKFRLADSGLDELHMPSVPLGDMCLSEDDDILPWFNYPMDEALGNDYCSSLLPGISGVTVEDPSLTNFDPMRRDSCSSQAFREPNTMNSLTDGLSLPRNSSKSSLASEPNQNHLDSLQRGGCGNQPNKDSNINSVFDVSYRGHRSSSKGASLVSVSEPMKPGPSQNFAQSTQFPTARTGQVSKNTGTRKSNPCITGDPIRLTNSAVGYPSEKLREPNPGPSSSRSKFINFSHFSRPAALYKSTVENNCATADSGPLTLDRIDDHNDAPLENINKSHCGPMKERSHNQSVGDKHVTYLSSLEAKSSEELPSKETEEIRQNCAAKADKQNNESHGPSTSKEPRDAVEPVIASSVCSGNGVDSASDDPRRNLKRKDRSNYDSEAPSDDIEEESVGRKSADARGSSSKRSRAAEVHNLSERRRRDRINEKMRALQELIPNCNKVDKASMLDEAIEYLKTLQLQLQIMSMGAGLYMPPMMLPAHMTQFSQMGVGMAAGLGFRMGMVEAHVGPTACPMLPMPSMPGSYFPSPLMPGHPALHGMAGANYPVMGLPGQGIPVSMPHAPPLGPFPGAPHIRPHPGLNANGLAGQTENNDAVCTPTSKEPVDSSNDVSRSMNQNSDQNQSRNGGPQQSEDGAVTVTATEKNDKGTSAAAKE